MKFIKVSAEESGIHTLPLVTLQGIWSKAASLLEGENTITPVAWKGQESLCCHFIPQV